MQITNIRKNSLLYSSEIWSVSIKWAHFSTAMSILIFELIKRGKRQIILSSLVSKIIGLRYCVYSKRPQNDAKQETKQLVKTSLFNSLIMLMLSLFPLARILYYLYKSPMCLYISIWMLTGDVYLRGLKYNKIVPKLPNDIIGST